MDSSPLQNHLQISESLFNAVVQRLAAVQQLVNRDLEATDADGHTTSANGPNQANALMAMAMSIGEEIIIRGSQGGQSGRLAETDSHAAIDMHGVDHHSRYLISSIMEGRLVMQMSETVSSGTDNTVLQHHLQQQHLQHISQQHPNITITSSSHPATSLQSNTTSAAILAPNRPEQPQPQPRSPTSDIAATSMRVPSDDLPDHSLRVDRVRKLSAGSTPRTPPRNLFASFPVSPAASDPEHVLDPDSRPMPARSALNCIQPIASPSILRHTGARSALSAKYSLSQQSSPTLHDLTNAACIIFRNSQPNSSSSDSISNDEAAMHR